MPHRPAIYRSATIHFSSLGRWRDSSLPLRSYCLLLLPRRTVDHLASLCRLWMSLENCILSTWTGKYHNGSARKRCVTSNQTCENVSRRGCRIRGRLSQCQCRAAYPGSISTEDLRWKEGIGWLTAPSPPPCQDGSSTGSRAQAGASTSWVPFAWRLKLRMAPKDSPPALAGLLHAGWSNSILSGS